MICKECKRTKQINVTMHLTSTPGMTMAHYKCPVCGIMWTGGPNPNYKIYPNTHYSGLSFMDFLKIMQVTPNQQFQQAFYNHGSNQKASPDVPKLTYELTHNDAIVAIKFHSIPSKGWWKESVQPAIDFSKALVPATMRSYNSSTFIWEFAIEYWPALKTAYENAFKFTCTEGKVAPESVDPLKNVKVDDSYKENFYHKQEVVKTVESAASIAEKLSTYLGVKITTQDINELKKLYRAKARELHPDLGGDAQKMSELNRLWTLYTAGGVN
jgi:hypothetical protein